MRRLFGLALFLVPSALFGQAGRPTITITPSGGEYTSGTLINYSIEFCDNQGLNVATRIMQYNGANITPATWSYNIGSPGPCMARGVATGTVTVGAGSNTLRASIEDNTGLWSQWRNAVYSTPVAWSGVSVRPENQFVDAAPGSTATFRYRVRNLGDVPWTYTFTAVQQGLGGTGSPSPSSVTLGAGQEQIVAVSATASGTTDASGRVWLRAVGGATVDSAFSEVTSRANPGLTNGVVLVNPSGARERDLCVAIGLGSGTAAVCGELRATYALPATNTRGQDRTPMLVYTSETAESFVLIPALVTLTEPWTAGATLTASITWLSGPASGTARAAGTWQVADWNSTAGVRRITAVTEGSSLPTGRYDYRLDVTTSNGQIFSATGVYLHVNRMTSPYGAGWWLAGLEEIVPSGIHGFMWVGADGSARMYAGTASSCVWMAAAIDRPDSLVGSVTATGCDNITRLAGNGLRVVFNSLGQHTATVTRLGATTGFTHAPGAGVSSIQLPSGLLACAYQFTYTGGVLDSILAPSAGATPRAVKVWMNPGGWLAGNSRWRVTAFRGPDGHTVNWSYLGGTGWGQGRYLIEGRTDRLGVTTTYSYDWAARVISASTPASTQQVVTQVLRSAESQGFGNGATGQAMVLDSVYTRLDGPRTDVADIWRWWINRFGAPVRTSDPVGIESRIRYSATWPGLPDSTVNAAGLSTRVSYNGRGLPWEQRTHAPNGGADAVTTITYHPTWDMPTAVTTPDGVTVTRTYNAANGNMLSERPGPDAARTTWFGYNGVTGLLETVLAPLAPAAESLARDPATLNVSSVTSPTGRVTTTFRDGAGRDTLVLSPIEQTPGGMQYQYRRTTYDSAGRPWEIVTYAPALPYSPVYAPPMPLSVTAESLFVRTTYDAEGRPTVINTFSRPNLDNVETACGAQCGASAGLVGSVDIRTYDGVGRQLTQRLGSGPREVFYDPAGNIVRELTRNNHEITSRYDAAGRLEWRAIPSVTYASERCGWFAPGGLSGAGANQCLMFFPYYSNVAGGGLTIAADTIRFSYDFAGRTSRADNVDARIARTYFPSGALRTDTLRMRNYAGTQYTAAVFGQAYTYDPAGRRLTHVLPTNLADGTISYSYNAAVGNLEQVLQGTSRIRITMDAAGRQDSLLISRLASGEVLGVIERRWYDGESQATKIWRWRNSGTGSFVTTRYDSLTYDARGKVRIALVESAVPDVSSQTIRNSYSGLGAALATERWSTNGVTWDAEQFRTTAMGTVVRGLSTVGSQTQRLGQISTFGQIGQLLWKQPFRQGTEDVALYGAPGYRDTTYSQYDAAGNAIRSGANFVWFARPDQNEEWWARHYYGADNRLRVTQRYSVAPSAERTGAWEEYRYDALGRRILTRSRRGTDSTWVALCGGSCVAYVERTVWDGDQVLYELRSDGADSRTNAQLDQLTSFGLSWGKAGYVHVGGIDHPVVTMDGRVPNYNWRGLAESSVWNDGSPADCSLGSGSCQYVAWPAGNSMYHKAPPVGAGGGQPVQWVGTVLANGAGSAGLLNRRNRSYDPATGQFTQQDPIGIAGGANTYGFADGDPLNFDDPFGLHPCLAGPVALRICAAIATAAGGAIGAALSQATDNYASGRALGKDVGMAALQGLRDGAAIALGAELVGAATSAGGRFRPTASSPSINPRDVAGKSPSEIDGFARASGLRPAGPNPASGQGAYLDPVTGCQRILCHPNATPPHAHVNNAVGQRLGLDGSIVPANSPAAHLPIRIP